MRRHAERDDVVLLAMELEFGRLVALVAVEDQQPVSLSILGTLVSEVVLRG
jgi:hypothetical protein